MKKNNDINYAEAFEDKLREKGLSFNAKEKENGKVFIISMGVDNVPSLKVIMVTANSGDSTLYAYLANDVDERIRSEVMHVINKLNRKYRYICLCIDDDGDVCASYDLNVFGDEEAAGIHMLRNLVLFADICDSCIPPIMKTVWKAADEEEV